MLPVLEYLWAADAMQRSTCRFGGRKECTVAEKVRSCKTMH
jgi:hypothetical protein